METSLKSQEDEHTKANDDLYKKLQEVKGQMQTSEGQCLKLQSNIDETTEKLSVANQKIQELESALTSKVCLDIQNIWETGTFEQSFSHVCLTAVYSSVLNINITSKSLLETQVQSPMLSVKS